MDTESAIRAALVMEHRAAFMAGVEQPEPAECCTDIGAEDPNGDRSMEMLGGVLAAAIGLVAFGAMFAIVFA